MSKQHTPFRFETVGSFLRPDYLKKQDLILKTVKSQKKSLPQLRTRLFLTLLQNRKKPV